MRRFRLAIRRAGGSANPAVPSERGRAVTEADGFEALGASFPAYYVAVGMDGQVLSMNPAMLQALGYRLDEVIGQDYVGTFVPEEDRAALRALFENRSRQERTVNEHRILTRDGRVRWCEWHGTPVLKDGQATSFFGLGIDITERKQEAALRRQTEASLRTLLDTIPDLVWLKAPDGRYLECNHKFERLYGVARQELLGRTDYDFVDTRLADLYTANDQASIAAGRPMSHEEEVTYADDGHYELLESIKTPVRDDEGRLLGVLGIGRDITERQRTAAELQRSKAGLAALIESTQDLIWSVDRQYRLTTFNSLLDEHFRKNYGTHAFLGALPEDVIPPALAATWPARYDRAMTQGPYQVDLDLPDGRTLAMSFHPIHFGEGVEGVSVFGKDVSETRRFLAELEASEQRYRAIVDNAPMGIFRRDLDGHYLMVNRSLLEQFECADQETFERCYGRLDQRWARPEQHEAFRARLLADRVIRGFEMEARLQSGKTKWFLIFAFLDEADSFHFNGFSVDITRSKLAEQERTLILEQLHHSQKMDAIGQLAGGIAHDFNNMLGGIIGAADLLKSAQPPLPEEKRVAHLDLILQTALRAGDLTGKLLAFAHKAQKVATLVDVARLVQDTAAILQNTIDKRIAITVEDRAEGAAVLGDGSMLASVFMNMGINASHAMPEGGFLAFSLQVADLDEPFCAASPYELTPGRYVKVEVRDSGCGMPPEILGRIFEPFFTTKAHGEGTGLGLAAAYGTIQDHHGAIQVFSEVGVGTAFHVYLPLAAGEAPQAPAPVEAVAGTGTILVVDDEEFLRIITETMLEELGYTVLLASNGWEGVELFKLRHRELDLVIMDMMMPVMGGRQAFELMNDFDPTVPVVLASGLGKDDDFEAMTRLGLRGFVRKPYRLAELSRVVAGLVVKQPK